MASLQNNFLDFLGLFAQPPVGRKARSVGDCKETAGRAWVGKANLDTEGEVLRQIDRTQQLYVQARSVAPESGPQGEGG